MMNTIKIIITTVLISVLTGCASPARVDKMVATNENIVGNQPLSVSLLNNIYVTSVLGGEKTNPLWTSEIGNTEFKIALEESLKQAGMYSVLNDSGKYELVATLKKVDQPLFGVSMTVSMQVRYRLIDKSSRQPLFDEVISDSYTARFSDSFLAVERLRLANEGSARVNITKFIDNLYSLKITRHK